MARVACIAQTLDTTTNVDTNVGESTNIHTFAKAGKGRQSARAMTITSENTRRLARWCNNMLCLCGKLIFDCGPVG
jgi:hypothetical protein